MFFEREDFMKSVACPLGLEPRRTVLETVMLPLHHGHIVPGEPGNIL